MGVVQFWPSLNSLGEYVQVAFLSLGLFSFAPHVLIGLAAREWVHPKAGTSAHGLVSFIARLGGAAAGAPFRICSSGGWGGGMWLVVGMSLFSGVAMIPLWYKMPYRLDVDEERMLGRRLRRLSESWGRQTQCGTYMYALPFCLSFHCYQTFTKASE